MLSAQSHYYSLINVFLFHVKNTTDGNSTFSGSMLPFCTRILFPRTLALFPVIGLILQHWFPSGFRPFRSALKLKSHTTKRDTSIPSSSVGSVSQFSSGFAYRRNFVCLFANVRQTTTDASFAFMC